jgi:hypothetical protein
MYANQVTRKMASYAHRMRDLINEAYANGVVLTAPTPEPSGTLLALSEDETLCTVAVFVPITGHHHLQLDRVDIVKAFSVVKKVKGEEPSAIVQPLQLPVPRAPTKIIPIIHKGNTNFFVSSLDVKPWEEAGVVSSALKFGERFDLLGISLNEEMIASGTVDVNATIDPEILFDKLFYRAADGSLQTFHMRHHAGSRFFANIQGDYRTMQGQISVQVPRSEHSSSRSVVRIYGSVNLQYGTCEIKAECDDLGIIPLGYTLDAMRRSPPTLPAGLLASKPLEPS